MNLFAASKNFLRQAHYLSLDVVIGALFSHAVAVRLPDGRQPVQWTTLTLLGICVFIIYGADRLLDVRKGIGGNALATPRHRFHAERAFLLKRVLVGLAVVAAGLLFWLPQPVLWFGVITALVCGGYLAGVARLPSLHPALVWKEPIVALLYTVGIWGSAWAVKPSVSGVEAGLGVLFLLITFQNLLLFAVMESYEYPEAAFSPATVWGVDRTDKLLRILTIVITLSALGLAFMAQARFTQRMAVIEGLMSALLYLIQRYPDFFLRNGRYRWLGDGVFLLPALIL